MKIDGSGDTEGIQAFWCACHKTTIPQDSAYSLFCGDPEEGECVTCADPRGIACECAGFIEGHRRCQNFVCMRH
eukprot:5469157-Amphidinium_carterae.1